MRGDERRCEEKIGEEMEMRGDGGEGRLRRGEERRGEERRGDERR